MFREVVWVAKWQSLPVTEHFTVSEVTSQCYPALSSHQPCEVAKMLILQMKELRLQGLNQKDIGLLGWCLVGP